MKKLVKLLFVFVIGIMFVACGGPKADYKLEGTYKSERLNYYDDGTLGEKKFTTIDITKNGDEYTVKGNYLYKKIEVIKNYIEKTQTYGEWEEIANNSYTFTGKLVEVKEGKPFNDIPAEKVIYFILRNEAGKEMMVSVNKNVDVKKLLSIDKRKHDYSNVANIKDYKKIDIIGTTSIRELNIRAMSAFRMEK